jgi:tetratricopeptide (TPR) repeat protein
MLLEITSSAGMLPAPQANPWQVIRGIFLLVVFLGLMGWAGFRLLKRSEDPARLIFKWIITLPVLGALVFIVAPMVAQGGISGAFGGVPLAAVCGLVLAIIWRDNLTSIIAKPFESLYSGGDVAPEPQPFYSLAVAKRKRGHYSEALADIRQQLEKFPNDFQGQFMGAEILAENLNDLHGAEMAIQRICHQKGHAPGSIAMVLNTLADWQMKYAQDREAARLALEKIMELLPDSESAALAAQRIAHLASTDQLVAGHDRKRFAVTPGLQDMGLLSGDQHIKAPEEDPARQVADYVRHLEVHPLDTEAREKLAVLYANHYERLDFAADQLEQLITHSDQPAARTVHWLNLLADLQLQHGANYETVRATLQRIVELFPDNAASGVARSRIAHLKLEFRGKEKNQAIKLGSYEQNIGLKRKD